MKAFGIEIRKTGTVNELYRDVDLVLSQSTFPEVQRMAIAHSLQHMLRVDSFFSICTIDACINCCQLHMPRERYDLYRTVHCVHWNEMLPDFKQTIIAMILDDFREILNPSIA